jgi:hypothetical protein
VADRGGSLRRYERWLLDVAAALIEDAFPGALSAPTGART